MLKGTLAAHLPLIFLGLLSSVSGDEGGFAHEGLPCFTSTFKEMCLERHDPASCQYWDTMRYKISDSDGLKLKSAFEMGSDDRKKDREGDAQEEISFEIPMESENNLQKRFTVFRRKAPTARGYKRGPGFRSWGGKRDMTSSGQHVDKKTTIASWDGKRDNRETFTDDLITSNNDHVLEKKPKFQNWGGKRDLNDISEEAEKRGPFFKTRGLYFSEPFKKHVPKRPQFQSWGGKRAPHPWYDYISFLYSQPRFLLNGGEKRKFSSWGGKRFDESQQDSALNGEDDVKIHVFQNWGGKSGTADGEPNRKEPETGESGKERRKREVETNRAGEEHRKGKSSR